MDFTVIFESSILHPLFWMTKCGLMILFSLANIIGSHRQTTSEQHLVESFFPAGQYILDKENDNKWVLFEASPLPTGYLYIGEGKGYNGTVRVFTHTDTVGQIIRLDLTRHSETPSYVDRIISNGFLKRAGNFNIREFAYDEPLDAVSGATVTSNAVIEAVGYSYLEGEELPYEDAACKSQTRPAIPAVIVPEMEMGTVVG